MPTDETSKPAEAPLTNTLHASLVKGEIQMFPLNLNWFPCPSHFKDKEADRSRGPMGASPPAPGDPEPEGQHCELRVLSAGQTQAL